MRAPRRRRTALVLLATLVASTTSCRFTQQTSELPVGLLAETRIGDCFAAAVDRDLDGIDDGCELELARAFAPVLVVDRRDCSWDGGRLAGGYFYAVQPGSDPGAVRIAYLPGYFRDCGWTGLPCATRGRGCSAHPGDSELIAVEARRGDAQGRWRAEAVFLTAHCFGRSGGRCRWYRGDQLHYFTWAESGRGAPHVWVARGKHANYPSARECDSGHWYYDSCDGNDAVYRFPILTGDQNIGSRRHPFRSAGLRAGCAAGEQLRSGHRGEAGTLECFWDETRRFRGWQRDSTRGATPYALVLTSVGF